MPGSGLASPEAAAGGPDRAFYGGPPALDRAPGRLVKARLVLLPPDESRMPSPAPQPGAGGPSAASGDGPAASRPWSPATAALLALLLVRAAAAADGQRWSLADSDAAPRIVGHTIEATGSRSGGRCERLRIEASQGTRLRLETPVGPAAVLDEFRCSAWVRSNRPGARIAVRVTLPNFISNRTGRSVETLVAGTTARDDRWTRLELARVPEALARQLPALRLEHGPRGDAARAFITHVVLEAYGGPGLHDIAIEGPALAGVVPTDRPAEPIRDAAVLPAAALETPAADPPAGLARGVLEVDGLPFFPRALDHHGEPLGYLAELGCNCVRFAEPASLDVLAAARAAGLWVICPPPAIPDVDPREPEATPVLRNWDRVIAWDLGTGLAAGDVASVAERGRRVRACDPRAGRPLLATADSGLRELSRHVDMLVARRTVLGTSLELADYLTWLRERPRLARPGTPLVAEIATEVDGHAARQAAALGGVGERGLAVDTESLSLAAFSAVAAGARGVLFASSGRLDAADRESVKRAAAVREANLRLALMEPWAAAGRFAALAKPSSPDVQAFVLEAARARMVVVWRCPQGAQCVAGRYAGGDLPGREPLTLLVPGVPEAHQAWELRPGSLAPVRRERVTGGVAITLDGFTTHALVLLSGDPAVTAHIQKLLQESVGRELAAARSLAAVGLAETTDLVAALPPAALAGPPPVAAGAMLAEAGRCAARGEATAAADPLAAIAQFRLAAAVCGQCGRRIWENGVRATGSMVASPLSTSVAGLAAHWRFVDTLATTTAAAPLLPAGDMERIEDLASSGWRHFALPPAEIRTHVEITPTSASSGRGSLRLVAAASRTDQPPVVVETPPVWVTTPPIQPPGGSLVEISAQVHVPGPMTGSVDGLIVYDSLGGPALAERVRTTRDWSRLVLYRVVPADASAEPLVVTFALTGLGEALIDDVAIRVLERSAPGTGPAGGAGATAAAGGFPGPAELLRQPPAATAAPAAWPGLNLGWPGGAPFGRPPGSPPPGPGGGTIDPFKRARNQPPPAGPAPSP